MNILEKIVNDSRAKLEAQKSLIPISDLKSLAQQTSKRASFLDAFANSNEINIIAELKKASPSKGIIREEFPFEDLAVELEQNGAKALSVLTEENYFLGSLKNLELVSKKVSLPLLRKDFIYDEYQIYQAKVAGASAILLIAAMLKSDEIKKLSDIAKSLDLDVLLEVHNHKELETALALDEKIIGVNARNLTTFNTSLDISMELIKLIPNDKIAIAESAITSKEDINMLKNAGANGFLIGETIMRGNCVGETLRSLL